MIPSTQHGAKRLLAILLLLATATATLGACKKDKPAETPVTEDPTTTAQDDWATIPPVTELALISETPRVETLGEEGGVTAIKVGELLVLHKPTPANQIVTAQLYFIGGAQRLNASTSGVERLALSVATSGGTESTPKDVFNSRLDAVGASIGAFTERDYSGISMKTILPYFDEVFDLYIQTLFEPAMPLDEIELTRTRQIAQIDALLESPDSQVSHIATQTLFEGHPYSTLQLGERSVVEKLSREELLGWQRALLQPNQMVLVVVGDVAQEKLTAQLQKNLGRLTSTRKPLPPLPALKRDSPAFIFSQRDLPTNYIFGLFQAPAPGTPDYAPMVVAMEYLSDRLFEEVRTKRNLTYAVSAGISARKANYGYLYVTAVDPTTTVKVILDEVDKLQGELMTPQGLKETLNVYITNYYMGQETNGTQAAMLAAAYITTGDWRYAIRSLKDLQQVKPEDVQRVVKTYVKNLHFGAVGPDETSLPKAIMTR